MTTESESRSSIDFQSVTQRAHEVIDCLDGVILGKRDVIRQVLVALLSRGHLLIEDVPGVGKTTLARSLAEIVEGVFQRISFTSDLMPSDILGVSIYKRESGTFEFQKGPIFTNILLADELNRTTPKTQSAFLEAMESGQVTIEKTTYDLPNPFLVMATQNPLEFSGTFPLPVSQLDRFLMRVAIGYPDQKFEEKILDQYRTRKASTNGMPGIRLEEVLAWQEKVPLVAVEESLVGYMAKLAAATRQNSNIDLGVSPRATLALQRAAQSSAVLEGRDYVIPDDIQALIVPVWAHRIILKNQVGIGTAAHGQAAEAIEEIVRETPVPT